MIKLKDIISIPHQENNSDNMGNSCDFILSSKLGEGTFGTVRLGRNVQTGEEVAVKILDKVKMLQLNDKTRVEREIKILKCLRHANIVHLYSVIQTQKEIYLIMEYIKGKELFDYIISKNNLTEQEACKYYQQIISGVEYMHKLGIVHRDLKPENLILEENSNDIKIVDFGLSNLYNCYKGQMLSSACGSPCYAAPEMLKRKQYKPAPIDIWATGIILYIMLCGCLPFEEQNKEELYKKICAGKFTIPEYVSEGAKDLIRKILTVEPERRINIFQIKHHPWFNMINAHLNMNEGLLINKVVIPIDEIAVDEMINKYGFISKEDIRASILSNRHNDIATIYYLIMRKKVREGRKSIADLKSDLFINYINDSHNLFQLYNYDFDKVINARKYGIDREVYLKKKKHEGRYDELLSTKQSDNNYTIKNKERPINKSKAKYIRNNIFFHIRENNKGVFKGNLPKISTINFKDKLNANIKLKKQIFINTQLNAKTNESKGVQNNQMNIISYIDKYKPSFILSGVDNSNNHNNENKINNKSPLNTQSIASTNPTLTNIPKQIYHSKSEPNNERYAPCDLCYISLKCKKKIKEHLISILNNLKLKQSFQNSTFIIESIKDKVKIEINIEKIKTSKSYILKFKRLYGALLSYWRISKNILYNVEL